LEEKIKKIVESVVMGFDASKLGPGDNFKEAGIDSLDIFSIIMEVQNEFGVQVSDDEAEECNSIGAIIAMLEKKQAA